MTKISEITIENFRGIKKAEIKQLDQVNIFIGKNGAGKSTILEAIYLASAWVNPSDELRRGFNWLPEKKIDYILYRRGSRGSWKKHRHFLWFTQEVSENIKIRIQVHEKGSVSKLNFILNYKNETGNVWLDLIRSYINKDSLLSIIESGLLGKYAKYAELLFGDTDWPIVHKYLHSYPLFNYASKLVADYSMESIHTPHIKGKEIGDRYKEILNYAMSGSITYLLNIKLFDKISLVNISEYERKFWPRLLAKRYDKVLVEMLKKGLEEGIEGLTYVPVDDEYVLVAQLPETSIRVDDLGEGARDSLLIMMPILVSENTAILLEEPEAHLHPGGLSLFLKYLFYAARERSLQLFITTHSIELVNMALSIGEEDKIGVKVFYVERDKNGVVDTRILEKVDVDTLQKLGLDPRFLGVI